MALDPDLPGLARRFQESLHDLAGPDEAHIFSRLEEAAPFLREAAGHGPILWEDAPPSAPTRAPLGVCRAWKAAASTGSILLRPPTREASWASLLADRVVALASLEDLLPDLEALFASLAPPEPAALLVTGSSRTADIEKELVIPAHGPSRLDVLLLEEAPDLARLRAFLED